MKRESIFWHFPLYLQGSGSAIVKPVFGTDRPYWRGVPATVMRKGDWKLFYFYEDKSIELYTVRTDIAESTDVAAKFPDRTAAMKTELLAWVRKTKAPTPSTPNPAFDPKASGGGAGQRKGKGRRKKKDA